MPIPNDSVYLFRQAVQSSYIMYRELCQLLDACLLVPESLGYNGGFLVAGFIYLLIGINLKVFSRENVINEFGTSSLYILDEDCTYNIFFNNFLSNSLKIQLSELLPFAQYASKFFDMPMCFALPKACKINDYVNKPYEDMLSYMAHNSHCLQFCCDKLV